MLSKTSLLNKLRVSLMTSDPRLYNHSSRVKIFLSKMNQWLLLLESHSTILLWMTTKMSSLNSTLPGVVTVKNLPLSGMKLPLNSKMFLTLLLPSSTLPPTKLMDLKSEDTPPSNSTPREEKQTQLTSMLTEMPSTSFNGSKKSPLLTSNISTTRQNSEEIDYHLY